MNKKYYLSSLAAATLLAGCTSDELVPQQNEEVADVLANRPKIEVAFGLETSATRMHGNETGVTFDQEDHLGAVLVDQGLSIPANYYTLATGNTHIANNKFYYDGEKFVTDGTMCVGAWLFYANYDAANTTSRGSIKYDLPIVQEYAQDYSEMAKHDFKFSPIINLEGKENGYFTDEPNPDYAFTIPMISAFTYAQIKLEFPKDVTVQKLVLKPSTVAAGNDYDPFYHTYELNNGSSNNGLSTAVADLNNYPATVWRNGAQVYVNRQGRLNEQRDALMKQLPYIPATVGSSGSVREQLIALNCLDSNLEPSKSFMTNMLIPSGEYKCIRLYAYTDKGVYVYNINDECEAAQTDPADPTAVRPTSLPAQDNATITLKRERVTMHNIAAVPTTNQDYKDIQTKAIRMTDTRNNVQLQASTETDGTVVISQKDLVAVINGITVAGQMNVRVLGNMVKITEEVAKAIKDAEKRVNGDIQVYFDKAVDIEGTAEGYTLTDVTFAGDATLTTGSITLGDDINIPAGKKLTVNSGATLNVNTKANNNTPPAYIYDNITNNGTLNANVSGLVVGTVVNSGTFNVTKEATITTKLENSGTVNINDKLTTAFTSTRGTITNNATLDIVGNSENKAVHSNGRLVGATINNNGVINVRGAAAFENKGIINNAANAKIISGEANVDGSSILNHVGAVVNNDGFLYCFNGNNTIKNLGTINAKSGSTTYITYNSDASEIATPTRSNKMGVINLDSRSEDVSVTKTEQKGYIVWTTAETVIRHQPGDKYNKVVLSSAATVNDNAVRYIETSKNLTLTNNQVQELTFTESATLLTTTATVGYLEIATDKIVKLPTENVIAVETVTTASSSKTKADINNKGTLLVGGDLWSSEIQSCPATGIFAAGDGNNTAFHWNQAKS